MMNPQMMAYQPQPAPFNRNNENCLYVGNLHPELAEDVFFGEFCRFGTVTGCKIMWNTYTRESRCFGFITYANKQDAEKAQSIMNGAEFYKREIRVYLKKNLKNLNPDANFIIKDLDKSVTTKQLTDECKKYGDVVSCFVRKEEIANKLESLGYGYVQFVDSADCQEFIEHMNGKDINGKQIKVERFVSSKLREKPQTKNIYIKQFPNDWNKEQIDNFIDVEFGKFGNINLKGVYQEPKLNKFYAFVSFDEASQATEAINHLNNYKFNENESLYVSQAQSKSSRRAMLRSERTSSKTQNNLYIRSIKADITKDELLKAVSKYGKVISICLKEWKEPVKPVTEGEERTEPPKALQFGFFNYETSDEAFNCLANYKKDEEIRNLVDVDSETTNFVFVAQSKHTREQYLRMSKRNHSAFNNMQFMGGNQFGGQQFPGGPQFSMRNPKPHNFKPQGKGVKRIQPPYGMGPFVQGMPMNVNPQMGMGGPMIPHPYPMMQMNPNPAAVNLLVPGMKEQTQANNSPFSHNLGSKDNKEIAKELRQNKEHFLELKSDEQKNLLGNIMYMRVKKFNTDETMVPKITGMLIDLEVLDYDEIVEIIENDESLKERIDEAIDVISETAQTE